MKYISTRSDYSTENLQDILLSGILPDGGVLVPEYLPFYNGEVLQELANLPVKERILKILVDFLPGFSEIDLRTCLDKTINEENFKENAVAKVVSINKYVGREYLLELWYGHTGSYKDLSVQLYLNLLEILAEKYNLNLNFIAATCGDTGIALEHVLKQKSSYTHSPFAESKAVILYPNRGLSYIQNMQLQAGSTDKVLLLPIAANFDQIQALVKEIFLTDDWQNFNKEQNMLICAANAWNWGRILPQIAVFIAAYTELLATNEIVIEDKMNLVIPTGNFSNLLSAWYARQMGIPFNHLICGSNRNKVTSDFFSNGNFDTNRKLTHTIAPSMDVLRPENIERFLFELSSHNYDRVNEWMNQLNGKGEYQVENDILRRIQAVLVGGFSDDNAILRTIREVYDYTDFAIDTHTAIGFNVNRRYEIRSKDEAKVLYVSPTTPYKVPQAVCKGLGIQSDNLSEEKLLQPLAREIGVYISPEMTELENYSLRDIKPVLLEDAASKIYEFFRH